jgi:hypothetical protein
VSGPDDAARAEEAGSEIVAPDLDRRHRRPRAGGVHHAPVADEDPDVGRLRGLHPAMTAGIEEEEIAGRQVLALDLEPLPHLVGRRPRQREAEIGVHSDYEPRTIERRRAGAARPIPGPQVGLRMGGDFAAGAGRAAEEGQAGVRSARRRRAPATAGEEECGGDEADLRMETMNPESRSEVGGAGAAPARAAVSALLDEWERARCAVVAQVRTYEPAFLGARLPAGHEPTVLHVLRHLVGGAYTMTRYVLYALQVPPPPKVGLRATDITGIPEFAQASAESAAYTRAALAGLSDADLERTVAARWGKTYTVESMLEHSLVHFLRHRRQLERLHTAWTSARR